MARRDQGNTTQSDEAELEESRDRNVPTVIALKHCMTSMGALILPRLGACRTAVCMCNTIRLPHVPDLLMGLNRPYRGFNELPMPAVKRVL